MDPYDSDSSLEYGKDYTETNIYLGYASKEPTEDTISHLGGFPVCRAQL
jgi:pre-rRNA-processing protein TSR4